MFKLDCECGTGIGSYSDVVAVAEMEIWRRLEVDDEGCHQLEQIADCMIGHTGVKEIDGIVVKLIVN